MNIQKALLLLAAITLSTNLYSQTWDFTAPDFSNGSIIGQQGFSGYGGDLSTVDTSAGELTIAGPSGATIWRNGPVGFDNTLSTVEYTFTFTTLDNPGGLPFGDNYEIYFGTNVSGQDALLYIRRDGILSAGDGSGFFGGTAVLTSEASNTIVATLNYATDTYSVSVNGSSYFTDRDFNGGSNQNNQIRLRNSNYAGLKFTEISTAIVPEPSSYALISGALALSWLMVRRRK